MEKTYLFRSLNAAALVARQEGSLLCRVFLAQVGVMVMFPEASLVYPISPLLSAVPREPDKRKNKPTLLFLGPKGERPHYSYLDDREHKLDFRTWCCLIGTCAKADRRQYRANGYSADHTDIIQKGVPKQARLIVL